MPSTQTTPPAPPATTVAPTPATEYKTSEHLPNRPGSSPELAAALAKRAGIAPADAPKPPPQATPHPAQTPSPETRTAPPEPPAATTPDPKAFVPSDEQEQTLPSSPPSPTNEPPPEVIKSASAHIREAYDKLKSDFAARATEGELTKKQLSEYQAKAKSYEDRIKSLEEADTRAKDRAKELEKQVLAYDEQIRILDYTRHNEFHNKYVKPVSDEMQNGYSLVKELTTTDESGNLRYGTNQDFHEVLAQPNYSLMDKKAVELFGERMSVHVLEQAKKVKLLQQAQARAVENAAQNSLEWQKNRDAQAAAARTRAREQFEEVSNAFADKYPSLYKVPADDKEAAAAQAKGLEQARLIIDGQPPDMSHDEYLLNVAKLYHRAAFHPVRELEIQRLRAERDSYKSRLEAYEKSTPDTDSRKQPGGVTIDNGGVVIPLNDLSSKMRASLERRAGKR